MKPVSVTSSENNRKLTRDLFCIGTLSQVQRSQSLNTCLCLHIFVCVDVLVLVLFNIEYLNIFSRQFSSLADASCCCQCLLFMHVSACCCLLVVHPGIWPAGFISVRPAAPLWVSAQQTNVETSLNAFWSWTLTFLSCRASHETPQLSSSDAVQMSI